LSQTHNQYSVLAEFLHYCYAPLTQFPLIIAAMNSDRELPLKEVGGCPFGGLFLDVCDVLTTKALSGTINQSHLLHSA
jgi:hypothetical protein